MNALKLGITVVILLIAVSVYKDHAFVERLYQDYAQPTVTEFDLDKPAPVTFTTFAPKTTRLDQLDTLLQQQPQDTQTWLEEFSAELSELQLQKAYGKILKKARLFLNQRRLDEAETLAQVLLNHNPRNPYVHVLLGDVLLADKRVVDAVAEYYQAKHFELDNNKVMRLSKTINDMVAEYAGQLERAGDYRALRMLYSRLIQLDAGNQSFYLSLARAYLATGSQDGALEVLSMIPFDGEHAAEVEQIKSRLDKEFTPIESRGNWVGLTAVGRHFLVPVYLEEDVNPVELLIDTGASITVLKASVARELGFDSIEPVSLAEVNTANGIVRADVYELSSLTIANERVGPIRVAVLPLQEMGMAQGLLGMNVLSKFRFELDQRSRRLILNPH